MWILIVFLAMGDLILAGWLLRERRAHRRSRTALGYWRQRDAMRVRLTAPAMTRAERDLAERLRVLQDRQHAPRVPVSPARGTGGEAV